MRPAPRKRRQFSLWNTTSAFLSIVNCPRDRNIATTRLESRRLFVSLCCWCWCRFLFDPPVRSAGARPRRPKTRRFVSLLSFFYSSFVWLVPASDDENGDSSDSSSSSFRDEYADDIDAQDTIDVKETTTETTTTTTTTSPRWRCSLLAMNG